MTVAVRVRQILGAAVAVACLASSFAARARAQPPPDSALVRALRVPDSVTMRAQLRFLASDLLRGRAPGTPGADIAAAYIATTFEALGLEPAGDDGGYLQRVRLVGATPHPSIIVGARRQTTTLEYGRDFVAWPTTPDSAFVVDGDLVFVGFGIRAAEWEWDDFGDAALNGKILLILANDPGLIDTTRFDGRSATRYGDWSYKIEQAARIGAAGAVLVHTDESVEYPWSAVVNTWSGEQLLEDRARTTSVRFGAWLGESAARRLIEATGRDFEILMRRAASPGFRPIPLDAHIVVRMQSDLRRVETVNVVAKRPGVGTGPEEAVVYAAHYDHLGVRRPLGSDSIYNGAEDAAGVTTLMGVAAAFASVRTPLRRSIVFLVTTAAKAEMLGASAYIRAPAVPLEYTVAVVGLDRANVRGRTADAIALGAEWSSLRGVFSRAAAAEGLRVETSPPAELGAFHRSDASVFAKSGVPSFLMRGGAEYRDRSLEWGARESQRYLATRYHQPSDEIRADFRWGGVLQEARLAIRVGWELATGTEFPTWSPDAAYRGAGERLRLIRVRGGGM